MPGGQGGSLGKVLLAAVLLAGAGAAAWAFGRAWVREGPAVAASGRAPEPSPELADATLDRFEALRGAAPGARMSLGAAEVTSVLRHALPGLLPHGVDRPTVRFEDGLMQLSARVAVAAFPDLPALDEIVGLMPDTIGLEVRGTLEPFDEERVALHVDRLEAARIPLPIRLIPEILRALGRAQITGLPTDAVAVPLPQGIASVRLVRDSLVLLAGE